MVIDTVHHDGPFDAVAPSRNREGHPSHRRPMGAFDSSAFDAAELPPTPYEAQLAAANNSPLRPGHNRGRSSTSPVLGYYAPSPPPPPPKKNAIQEAWGVADPEPFEEFSAGGATHAPTPPQAPTSTAQGVGRTAYTDYWNENDVARNTTRNARRTKPLPPPQQIALPGAVLDDSLYPSEQPQTSPDSKLPEVTFAGSPPKLKRNRSLMQRIRTMRDNPNVPVTAPDPTDPDPISPSSFTGSPLTEEPALYYAQQDPAGGSHSTHSSMDKPTVPPSSSRSFGTSILTRLTRSPRQRELSTSPPTSPTDYGFVMVQPTPREKALPPTPRDMPPPTSGPLGYFDTKPQNAPPGLSPTTPYSPNTSYGGGTPLGRRRSLLSKMKNVGRSSK